MNIGNNIKTIRVSKQIKQKDLASTLGITPIYLSMIENDSKTPSLPLLDKLATVLEIPIAALFQEFKMGS